MSWLFSEAMMKAYGNLPSSQERVAEYSAATCSAGEPSAQLNVMPTPHPFWRNDKTMDASRFSRFGLTCAVLTANHGADLLTWYREVFLVRTSAQQEPARGLTESDQDCGVKWHESSVRYDRDTSSWRTHRSLWDEDLPWCSVTLPKWGLMRNGEVSERITSMPRTIVTVSGWLQRIPTPTVCGNYNRPSPGAKSGMGLATFVRKYPTATATASKGWSKNHNRANSNDRLDYVVEREAYESGQPGRLNPDWEEWLMGFPIGWTALKPLAMDRFREWQQQHSPCLQATEVAA